MNKSFSKHNEKHLNMLREASQRGTEGIQEWNIWRRDNREEEIHLEKTVWKYENLEGIDLRLAHLEGADFTGAVLQGADLSLTHIEATSFDTTWLQGANFTRSITDNETMFWGCKINRFCKSGRYTNASGVSLESACVDPQVKQLLEYNVRRKNWYFWYGRHLCLQWPVKLFWQMNDYGSSTRRIILVFLSIAIAFGLIYFVWGTLNPPGIISNLFESQQDTGAVGVLRTEEEGQGAIIFDMKSNVSEELQLPLVFVRAAYFSIVTMTTLGFGDMFAHDHSFWGHFLLALEVMFGYVMLGALVTRFAILFTSKGPAGQFCPYGSSEPKKSSIRRLWAWLFKRLAYRRKKKDSLT
jgi:hypothetical protein